MMEQAASLEEPQVLFDLPKLFSPSGKILTGPSYQIASSRKRKRRDIAIAVDGQGLNLYGVGALCEIGHFNHNLTPP